MVVLMVERLRESVDTCTTSNISEFFATSIEYAINGKCFISVHISVINDVHPSSERYSNISIQSLKPTMTRL